MNPKRAIKGIFICLICLTLVFQVAGSIAETNKDTIQSVEVPSEVVSLRTEKSKTYLMQDGSYRYVGFAENIHYKDKSGDYLEIDNSIIETRERDGYCLTNAANTWHVFFADYITNNRAITIENGDGVLSFNLVGDNSKVKIQRAAVLSDQREVYYREISEDNRAVVYKDVMPSVDIVYISKSGSLKEDIVLRDRASAHSFVFNIAIDNIFPIQKGNNICFIDDTGKEIFRTEDLFMEDAIGKKSDSVSLALKKENNNYSIIVSADDSFLNAEDTVYPVIIDPTIRVTGASDTFDTCVDEQYPSSNYYTSQNLWTGGKTETNTMRTYMKFTLPSGISASQVTNATLRVKKRGYATPSIKAYRVTQDWTSSSVTWNNKPTYTTSGGSNACTLDSGSWYKITVTSLVRSWLQGTYSNYGFLLKEPSETNADQKTKWYSSDAPSPNKPELVIDYTTGSTYTISYYGNGNTYGTTPDTQYVSVGQSIALRTNTGGMGKAGSCVLLGWNTNSSGTGTTYSLGQSITPTGNMSLYAKWSAPLYISRVKKMRLWVDKTYTDYYSNWISYAYQIASKASYPFYQTYNITYQKSSPTEMITQKSLCPNAPNRCTISSCGSNCNYHHTNANNLLAYVSDNGDNTYGLNTLFYYGETSCRGTHDNGVGGLAYYPGDQPNLQASIIQCFDGSDWGSVRRAQHEWSHNYYAIHNGEDGTYCTSPCIMNSGWDNTYYDVADVWCSRCKAAMGSYLGNY